MTSRILLLTKSVMLLVALAGCVGVAVLSLAPPSMAAIVISTRLSPDLLCELRRHDGSRGNPRRSR